MKHPDEAIEAEAMKGYLVRAATIDVTIEYYGIYLNKDDARKMRDEILNNGYQAVIEEYTLID